MARFEIQSFLVHVHLMSINEHETPWATGTGYVYLMARTNLEENGARQFAAHLGLRGHPPHL
jgi:hypothetical protein